MQSQKCDNSKRFPKNDHMTVSKVDQTVPRGDSNIRLLIIRNHMRNQPCFVDVRHRTQSSLRQRISLRSSTSKKWACGTLFSAFMSSLIGAMRSSSSRKLVGFGCLGVSSAPSASIWTEGSVSTTVGKKVSRQLRLHDSFENNGNI